jgi:hypothetical protein
MVTAPGERSLLGEGWREVPSFDDLEDLDEYESEEEVGVLVNLLC